jgi:hypothetical protein
MRLADRRASGWNSGALAAMDAIMLALGFSLFAATIAYAYACERL